MRAVVVLPLLASCAITVDVLHAMTGPHSHSSRPAARIGTDRVERWREVSFDDQGLVCMDVEAPWTRGAHVGAHVVNPNGYKIATQVFTVLEAALTGIYVGGNEISCAQHGCDSRSGYKWLVPIGLDVLWGTYRSFTIHDEILRSSDVDWTGPEPPDMDIGARVACPMGTEVALYGDSDQLTVRIEADGHGALGGLAGLVAFVAAHPAFAIADSHIRLESAGAVALVEAFRAKLAAAPHPAEPPAPTAATPPPPPPPPSGVTIDVKVDVPVPRR